MAYEALTSEAAALSHDRIAPSPRVGAGCGGVALNAGATVVAVDYSTAVDACWANHRGHPRLPVIQADVYNLPFPPGEFDFVYCIGVLQHTPDVRGAFMALAPQLRVGGRLVVGVYPKIFWNLLWPKYWLRPITKRMPPDRLFHFPVANDEHDFPLSRSQVREWAVLNTFDMFAPAHDSPQSASTLKRWIDEAGLDEAWVGRSGFLVGRGTKRRLAEDQPQSASA
jgi:SAM-dependent methyltransferase